MGKVNVTIPLLSRALFAGLDFQYMDKRRTLTVADAVPVLLSDLTLSTKEFPKGFDVSVSAYNMFNRNYGDPAGLQLPESTVEQDGRTFRVKLTYRFGQK